MEIKTGALILAGICIVIFLMQVLIPGFEDSLLLNDQAIYEPWRFLTSIFLHGGLGHLAYNLFALVLFGLMTEHLIGTRKLILVFFISGIFANILGFNFYPSSLGASGAIFGLLGLLIILRPKLTVWAFGLPLPLFIAGILWVLGDIVGAAAFLSGNPINNTGNIAHLSGIFVGILFGIFWRKHYSQPGIIKAKIYLDEEGMRAWEERHLR